eukprot:4848980-Pyramimonas_sp.AAC.1
MNEPTGELAIYTSLYTLTGHIMMTSLETMRGHSPFALRPTTASVPMAIGRALYKKPYQTLRHQQNIAAPRQ